MPPGSQGAALHDGVAHPRERGLRARSTIVSGAPRSMRWRVCAELRGIRSAVCAAGILAADGRATDDAAKAAATAARIRAARAQLATIDGLDGAPLAALRAAAADLERAVGGVAEARTAGRMSPWPSLVDCYAAMTELRNGLWAFELRPEGAPLSEAALASYEEGFRSA